MRIAVIEHAGSGDYAEYIYSLIDEKAKEHDYLIKTWSNSVPAFQQQVEDNTIIYINIQRESNFSLKWLYNVKIPSVLKKTRAEIVIDLNGVASSKIKIPQIIIADDFVFNSDKKTAGSIKKYAAKNFQSSLQIARHCIAYSKQKINGAVLNQQRTVFIPYTSPEFFKTYEWHDKLMIKANYADNKEFFLAIIEDNATEDFVLLLQAFSKFKKWQQSNMQLLILPKHDYFDSAIAEKYKTYKYREDIKLLEDIEDKQIAAIFASAHSLLHVNTKKPNLLMIAVALQCSLPVISFINDDIKEYAGNACIYCAEKDAVVFGESIIKLYKDENLHAQLKQEAQKQAAALLRKNFADKLWQLVTEENKS